MNDTSKTTIYEGRLDGWFDLGNGIGPDEVRAFRRSVNWLRESPNPCVDHIDRRFIPFPAGRPDEVRCVACGRKKEV